MRQLGIHKHYGILYGGSNSAGVRLPPNTQLFPISITFNGTELANSNSNDSDEQLFMETYFDPVSQIRRGVIYRFNNDRLPWYLYDTERVDLRRVGDKYIDESILTYNSNSLSELNNISQRTEKPLVLIGKGQHQTLWKLISIENAALSGAVITLKALYPNGSVPSLTKAIVPSEIYTNLERELEKLVETSNKLEPTAIVDRCRDTLSIVFGQLGGDLTKDLGQSIKQYKNTFNNGREDKLTYAASLVARLHAQGKPNEREHRNLTPLSHNHSQLALNCVWIVLTELGWGK